MENQVLVNNMLFEENIPDTDYEYSYHPNVVGIATIIHNMQKHYFVYNTDERGSLLWKKELDSLNKAISYARLTYEGMKDTLQSLSTRKEQKEPTVEELCNIIQGLAKNQLKPLQLMLKEFLNREYRKDYILDVRIKTPENMINKIESQRKEGRKDYSIFDIPDIISLKISVDTEEDVIELSKLIEEKLEPIRQENNFKANLYYLKYYSLPFDIEVQIMTKEMKLLTAKTHDEYTKRRINNNSSHEF